MPKRGEYFCVRERFHSRDGERKNGRTDEWRRRITWSRAREKGPSAFDALLAKESDESLLFAIRAIGFEFVEGFPLFVPFQWPANNGRNSSIMHSNFSAGEPSY